MKPAEEKRIFQLPAGRVDDEYDLRRQLGIEDRQPGLAMMVFLAGLFVIGLMVVIVAGLSFAHWKHLIF